MLGSRCYKNSHFPFDKQFDNILTSYDSLFTKHQT